MNKLKKIFTIIILFLSIYILFKYNYILKTTVMESYTLWLTKVFPSLFIMFILNDLIIKTNILDSISHLINPFFNKIFHTEGDACLIFILSILSGSPTNAYLIKEMFNNLT